VRAAVRSERAAALVRDGAAAAAPIELSIIDYTDARALEKAARGCNAVVHFVGIIKETRDARYLDAHERTCEALARAAGEAGVERIIYLSILGATPTASNACLRSKGCAEEILIECRVPSCILRVPMVLGPGDFASLSLRGQATARLLPMFRGGATLQQPIDAEDVISAVCAALRRPAPLQGALDLGGPECLTHRALVARAARLCGGSPVVLPVPLVAARGAIGLLERLSANPPMTLAMLDVLQRDDRVDASAACKQLDIHLTPLDDTLRAYVRPEAQ
jgi:NADH dehydrogenase